MSRYNATISKLDMPARLLKLPIDERGYPVPKFVAFIDGKPDFRVARGGYAQQCRTGNLCWLCGERLGRYMAFVIGPMCAVNRVSSEPPSHLDCARFAVRACPFLAFPNRKRNEAELPDEGEEPGGVMLRRNPGVTLIWVTQHYQAFKANGGVLMKIGEAVSTEWYCRGREARREEIMASIESGLPILRKLAEQEGPQAIAALEQQLQKGLELVPA
jgi:hypothetical protein